MKKLIALLLCILMILSITACSQTKTSTSEPSTAPAQTTGNSTETKKDITIEKIRLSILSFFDPKTLGQVYQDTWQIVADELGYEIEIDSMGTEPYKTKMKVYLASGELPDIITMAGGAQQDPFIAKKMFVPVDNYLVNSNLKFSPAYLAKKADGHVYTVPVQTGNSTFMFYNKSILKQLGMEPPENMEDIKKLVDACKTLNDINPIGIGVKDRWLGDFIFMALVSREDPHAYAKASKGDIKWNSEPFLNAATRIKELVDMGAFNKDLISTDVPTMGEMFMSGKYATVFEGGWRWTKFYDAMGDNLGYVAFPQTGADKDYKKTALINPAFGIAVSSLGSHIDESFKYVIRYAQLINESKAKNGNMTFIETTTKAEKPIPEAYQELINDINMVENVVPSWSDYLDADKLEAVKDLAQALYGSTLTPQEYVDKYQAIMGD